MNVIGWLLDSDPSIRWQVKRDLLVALTDEVAAERARVAAEGWGAQLLALQSPDGYWAGERAFFPKYKSTRRDRPPRYGPWVGTGGPRPLSLTIVTPIAGIPAGPPRGARSGQAGLTRKRRRSSPPRSDRIARSP